MPLGNWLGIAALVVAALVGVATVLATRRWGNRRRKVRFDWKATPLLPQNGDQHSLLKVTYRDYEVEDPHLLEVELSNIGSADVATTHFDSGRPLVIIFNCRIYGLISSTHPDRTVSPGVGGSGYVELSPSLFSRGDRWRVAAVVSGAPNPEVRNPLIDTDVVSGAAIDARRRDIIDKLVMFLPVKFV